MKIYLIIGMYDGLPEYIEAFTNCARARRAFEEWTGQSFDHFDSRSCIHEGGSLVKEIVIDLCIKKPGPLMKKKSKK